MRSVRWLVLLLPAALAAALPQASAQVKRVYVKKDTRAETILATLRANGFPTLEGAWHCIGPFDNSASAHFDAVYPPEKEIDLTKTYPGKAGQRVGWKRFPGFAIGKANDLARFARNDRAFVYLHHELDVKEALALPLALGSDDSVAVWLNGTRLLARNVARGVAPDQDRVMLKLRPGKNRLLIKVGNVDGPWALYVCPGFPTVLDLRFGRFVERDFPGTSGPLGGSLLAAEARHYRLVTLPVPPNISLEVGGLAFRPDGKLLVCTRRGDVWLIANPGAADLTQVKYSLFASGLHEPLGLLVDGKDVYVTQRPELTKLIDRDGDDVADDHVTICDRWGVSGDYHEFAFGPVRDRAGNFFVALNVGFAGDHQSRVPWRGWCAKITPKGELIPWATGLRSPNGIAASPDGDLFYCDNQGEWVATNKMHHIREGDFYGHQAPLRWVGRSPFAERIPETHASGMLYDGQPGKRGAAGMPTLVPPCVWFPYGRMGQSASEPRWDTTDGQFGPFAGQCFVGDQTRAQVMRLALEKVNGRYQGACFPFRSGFQCGINRMVFGPDGSLYAGQTNRGWGSFGGKAFGLQRLAYTGVLPFEIQTMKLTKCGFDLTFTKPLEEKTADRPAAYSLQSFTYYYHSAYGSDEVDRRAEKVAAVRLSADRRTVSLDVGGRRRGRVYELNVTDVRSADGDPVLHPEAYYTLNELP